LKNSWSSESKIGAKGCGLIHPPREASRGYVYVAPMAFFDIAHLVLSLMCWLRYSGL